jgi:nucleotide-binding universal stress UspA family protein
MTRSLTNTVVVGFDGSSAGERALEWATEEARQRDLRVHVIHVWQPPPMLPAGFAPPSMPDTEVILQDAVARAATIAPDVQVTTQAAPGEVAIAFVDASEDADTVVLGARGHRRRGARDFGSTAWQVATHALCPVVVVRELPDVAQRKAVVVGVDGSRGSHKALEYAFARAAWAGLEVVAVYGWHLGALETYYTDVLSDSDLGRLEARHRAELSGWVAPLEMRYPQVKVRAVAVRGHPVEALLQESPAAQLVVVGSRGRGGFRGLLLGSVGMDLLRAATCPVAIVRHSSEQR